MTLMVRLEEVTETRDLLSNSELLSGEDVSHDNMTAPWTARLEQQVQMEGDGCQDFQWMLHNNSNKIMIAVSSAPNMDWLGIGISENGGMKGADIAVVRMKKMKNGDTDFVIDDRISKDYAKPEKDSSQDVKLISANILDNGRIHAVIQRDIGTSDDEDVAIADHKQYLICASGAVDESGEIMFHGRNHAVAKVNLMANEGTEKDLPHEGMLPSGFPWINFERHVQMDGEGCKDVQWTLDRKSLKIMIGVSSAPYADWVGIGVSENGGMKGADISVVRKKHSKFAIDDLISKDYVKPEKDILQNAELISATVLDNGRIRAIIQRDIETCDNEDIAIESYKQYLICASGATDESGEILFHGQKHAMALVNLMADEELLFGRNFHSVPQPLANIEVAPGVTMWDDPSKANHPFPMDIQMPRITLDPTVKTNYTCLVVDIPSDVRMISFESVWGDEKSVDNETILDYLHHQTLYECGTDSAEIYDGMDGRKAFNCANDMPTCSRMFTVAKSVRSEMPSGIHLPARKGKYVLLVHYENSFRTPIKDDRSGI